MRPLKGLGALASTLSNRNLCLHRDLYTEIIGTSACKFKTSQLCSILSSHHDNCILMSGGRAWVSERGLVVVTGYMCILVLVAEAWTEYSLSL